ncbi:MAG: SurA N-terminal domain-containing protein [Candidatus Abyssubacteria bacterium]|nr:SurA N-terminal domain-containing protein [Candidatus Abyssubacteria bacterium]
MLLEYMRKHTKRFLVAIIFLIVPAFVLWGTIPNPGGGGEQTLIEIGDRKVSVKIFENYYRDLLQTTRANFGGALSPEIEKMLNLKQRALDNIIRDVLLEQEVVRLGIVVSDKEVQDSLKRLSAFQTDGKFDPAKWNEWLGNPGANWTAVSEQQRHAMSVQKVVDMIQSGARVTEEELSDEYRRQNEKATIEFIALKTSDLASEIEVSPEDLASYYERHKQEYAEPAKVKLAYVEFRKEPGQADFDASKKVAQDVLERIKSGDDFEELAEMYSDDAATKPKGGDLGFFGRGKMVKEFEEAAFSMAAGEVSDVIKSEFGYHIIKVEETKGEGDKKQVRARHILLKVEPSEETLVSLEEQAVRMAVGAVDLPLENVASNIQLSVETTQTFPETTPVIPGLGIVREITEILPGLQEGKTSDVIESSGAFYVVQVTERTPERIPELEEVEENVRAAAETEKALDLAKTRAEEIVRKLNAGDLAFDEVAGLEAPQEPAPFTRNGYPLALPFIGGLADSVFELAEGKAAAFLGSDSAYVILLKEKIAPDTTEYESAKESLKNRLLSERKRQVFEDYFQGLRERSGVKINEEFLRTV